MSDQSKGPNPVGAAIVIMIVEIIIAVFLYLIFATEVFAENRLHVLPDSNGGPAKEFMKAIDNYDGEVVMSGRYASSATLWLAKACVTPNAIFLFHGPSAKTRGLGLPFDEFERLTKLMADKYYAKASKKLAEWFMSTGRHRTVNTYRVTGTMLIYNGVKQCK